MLPVGGLLLIVSPLSGRVVGRYGPRWPLLAGGCVTTLAALILTGLAPGTTTGHLLAAYLLFGVGMGLLNPPITNAAVSGMPGEQAGVAAAIASTSRQVGMTLGIAVIGAIAGGTLAGGIDRSFAVATHAGWWVIVGLGGVILASGLLSSSPWAEKTARQAAERLDRELAPPGRRAQAERAAV